MKRPILFMTDPT